MVGQGPGSVWHAQLLDQRSLQQLSFAHDEAAGLLLCGAHATSVDSCQLLLAGVMPSKNIFKQLLVPTSHKFLI